jgi:ABC-type phosphate/phosphonate transport system substrate-binding protein
MLFESVGVVVDRDLRVVRGGCCEDIAFAVSVGSVDAGVICGHFLGQHEARQKDLGVDRTSLKVIARTQPFPTRIFSVRAGLPREAAAAMAQALLRLDPNDPAHARILSDAEIGAFKRTTEREYLAALTEAGRQAQRGRF